MPVLGTATFQFVLGTWLLLIVVTKTLSLLFSLLQQHLEMSIGIHLARLHQDELSRTIYEKRSLLEKLESEIGDKKKADGSSKTISETHHKPS